MEARHTPATHASWPVRKSQDDPCMTIVRPIGGAGWKDLLRGHLAGLLPLECPGIAPPWRAGEIKAARHAQVEPPAPQAVLREDRPHPERRQRDEVHLLRPSRAHAQTGVDAPGVRPKSWRAMPSSATGCQVETHFGGSPRLGLRTSAWGGNYRGAKTSVRYAALD